MLEKLGPTFIKFGQILADRPDIISEKLRIELKKLQTKVKPFDHDLAVTMIETELSAPIAHVFKSFDFECIGSASMGQVYKAVLKNGDMVVIKVQRPHIKEKINLDLQILDYIARKISEEYPEFIVMNLEGIVKEFGETLRNELNYFTEASNARRFEEIFKDVPYCKIPKVYDQLSTSKLLIMEFIEGISPDNIDELYMNGLDPKIIANNGVNVFLKMIFEHGFFHADPHAGNMFILPGNVIGLIDFGMVGSMKPSQMEFLAKFVRSMDQKDAGMLTEAILLLNTNQKFREREDLEFSLGEMLKKYKSVPYDQMKMSQLLDECFKIIRKYGIQIPGSIFLLIKSIATIEKVGMNLDPDISVTKLIRPYAKALVMKQYSVPRIGKALLKSIKKYIDLGKHLPDDINEIIFSLKTGKFTHDINIDSQEMFSNSIKQTGKTIALAILIGFIIAGTAYIRAKGNSSFIVNAIFFVSIFYGFILIFRLFTRLKT
ncbi:MAG: AarF/ABC1/UbiB kinase family protein [Bacteroidetes bacterium]|nr:AarF/ABC1/UbiB kinase family protein [Bacteroidota bacterium]